jgi:phage/plasmid-like protein (TIGR03299 family)
VLAAGAPGTLVSWRGVRLAAVLRDDQMPANLEKMAYRSLVPWHGLGHSFEGQEFVSADAMLRAAGLDWRVVKRPLYCRDATPLVDAEGNVTWVERGEHRAIPGRFALQRETDGAHYGEVTGEYFEHQNEDIGAWMRDYASANGLTMETMGSLGNGSKVWALCRAPATVRIGPAGDQADEARLYSLLATGHGGIMATTALGTTVYVVCQNTLTAALGSPAAYRLRHVRAFDGVERRKAAVALGHAVEEFERTHEAANALAARVCSDDEAEDAYRRLIGMVSKAEAAARAAGNAELRIGGAVAPAAVVPPPPPAGSLLDHILSNGGSIGQGEPAPTKGAQAERGAQVLARLMACRDEAPGQDLDSRRGTWWGWVNAVTYDADHFGNRPESSLDSAWFGAGAERKRDALEMALEVSGVGGSLAAAA